MSLGGMKRLERQRSKTMYFCLFCSFLIDLGGVSFGRDAAGVKGDYEGTGR